MRDGGGEGEEVLVKEVRVRFEKLKDLLESFALGRGGVVTALNEEVGEREIASRGRDRLDRCGGELGGKTDGCEGSLSVRSSKPGKQRRENTLLAEKEVLVALAATCFPLPSFNLAFCGW